MIQNIYVTKKGVKPLNIGERSICEATGKKLYQSGSMSLEEAKAKGYTHSIVSGFKPEPL